MIDIKPPEEEMPDTPIVDDNTFDSTILAELAAYRYEKNELNKTLKEILREMRKRKGVKK